MHGAPKDISSVQEFLATLRQIPLVARANAHLRTWFRGQARIDWELRPGVYRQGFPAQNGNDRLQLERHLSIEFRTESAGLRGGRNDVAEIYFLQQHYKMPTRLLDWTTNPLAALYFAVSDVSQLGHDGGLFLMDAYRLGPDQNVKDKLEGVASQRNKYFKRFLNVVFDWGDVSALPDFIIPIRPDYIDNRIHSQGGRFTFHVESKPVLTNNQNTTLVTFRVPSDRKATILRDLFLLGIDDFSIYGDLESLSRRLKSAHNIK